MKKFSLHIIIFFTILFFISCAKEEEVICTMEWRYISIDVKGGILDDFYTIRKYTGDTIRNEKDNIIGSNSYIILSDNYQNKIKNRFCYLPMNPSIFEYDYEAMRLRMKPVAEELMANRFHPRNFEKFVSWGFDEFNLDL